MAYICFDNDKHNFIQVSDCCNFAIDDLGFCSGCGELVSYDFDESDFNHKPSKEQVENAFKRKVGCGKTISEHKISLIKEDVNSYFTKKELEKNGWRVYKTVYVHLRRRNLNMVPIHEINADFTEELNELKKKDKNKLEKIFREIKGLPDLIAFKDEKILFVENKGLDPKFKELTEDQKRRRTEIEKAGFYYSLHRRKINVNVKLEQEEKEEKFKSHN